MNFVILKMYHGYLFAQRLLSMTRQAEFVRCSAPCPTLDHVFCLSEPVINATSPICEAAVCHGWC